MAIGKSMMIFMAVLIFSVAIISVFSIAQKDAGTDAAYDNGTINGTIHMTKEITSSSTGIFLPLTLVVGILFFGSAIALFKGRKK